MDGPTSHRSELVYAGHGQVNCDQDEHNPPVEERTCPAMGLSTCGASTELARILLLCARWLHASHHTTRLP